MAPSKGYDKIYNQNLGHALLSIVVLFGQDLGTDIVLYEYSKTNPDLLDEKIKYMKQACFYQTPKPMIFWHTVFHMA